jgi:hypothetical protein
MKKNLAVCICFFVLTASVFGQTIDKARYKAIDPFDYKLEEDKAPRGTEAKYKSVVEFVSEIKENNTVFYDFISLDKYTPLRLFPNPNSKLKPPSPSQTVTVYFTMNKRGQAIVMLDEFEDNRNKDEKGIGVEKTAILQSTPGIDKRTYKEITTDDYRDDALFTQEGEDNRKFFTNLQFVSQEGILYKFSSPQKAGETPVFLFMKARRRYPVFTVGQKMVVYFTATKEAKDYLRIDDIVLMR